MSKEWNGGWLGEGLGCGRQWVSQRVLHDKQAGMVTGVDMGVSCASITK